MGDPLDNIPGINPDGTVSSYTMRQTLAARQSEAERLIDLNFGYWPEEAKQAVLALQAQVEQGAREIAWLKGIVFEYVGTDAANIDPAGWRALSEQSESE